MDIKGSVAFVTGANGGIGQAFVAELLRRGAAKVYIGARNPDTLVELGARDDRLVPLTIDVTDADQIAAAVAATPDVTVLINNAGYSGFQGSMSAFDLTTARQEMDVNYFGPLALSRAFRRTLASAGGGAIVNMLSILSLASLPSLATYSASKASMLSLTRSMRAELAAQGTLVVGVLAVQTETQMGTKLPSPRLTPEEVASDALDAVQGAINDEISAGVLTQRAYEAFAADPKGFQAMLSSQLPEVS